MLHLHSKLPKRRGGFTVTELIVAATLLVVLMSVVGTLTVSSGRLWQDTRHYRLAIDELSNQLDRLTALDDTRLTTAIAELSASPQIRSVLPNPVLTAESLADENGTRVVLQLAWDRLGKSRPVSLVGWMNPLPNEEEPKAEEPETEEQKTEEAAP
ncbi:MAG: hypothetical protein GXP24_08845 [Planctomycetes bacterium]|nr:hypothetical protein [Planctomycetota bacterium]